MTSPGGAEDVMNDQPLLLPHQTMDIYKTALELLVRVHGAKIRHNELRDQAERASTSTFLAIGEGLPQSSPRMRTQYFERARASAWELASAMHAALALHAMDEEAWRVCQTLTVRTSAMLVALARR